MSKYIVHIAPHQEPGGLTDNLPRLRDIICHGLDFSSFLTDAKINAPCNRKERLWIYYRISPDL